MEARDDDALPLLVVTTRATRGQALALAREMGGRRLVACAQVNAIATVQADAAYAEWVRGRCDG